jgi:TonB-linked SusC/RagA family outer membrane protein
MIQKVIKLLLLFSVVGTLSVQAQTTVSGTITDATDGATLPGVNVIIKGTSNGTSSDFDGNYTLEVSDPNAILQFSFLGYTTKEVSVDGNSTVNVALEANAESLDEVVVTALGLSKEKKALGYSVTELEGDDLNVTKDPNVVNALSGKVAGVVVTQSTSGPAGGSRVVIRGNNSITGNNQPLYVVDGVPIDNTGVGSAAGNGTGEYSRQDYGTGVSDLNGEDIETMTVLKGPNAAALYGSRASNGVILITTKKGKLNKGLGVSFSSTTSFENPLLLPEYQNQYGRGSQGNFPQIPAGGSLLEQTNAVKRDASWGPAFDGSSQLYFTGEMKPYVAQPNNVEDFFRTGSTFTNAVTLSGGGEKASILFSYTNTKANSILPNSDVSKQNFNLRGFANLTDKFTIDSKVTYFYQEAQNRAIQGTEGILAYVYGVPRNVDISDMKQYQNLDNPLDPANPYNEISYGASSGNPYWALNHDVNEDTRRRFNGFAKLNYEFTDYLQAFVRVGTDVTNQDTYRVEQYGHHFYNQGRMAINEYDITETNADFLIMFNKDITEDLNLSVNAGGNHSYRTYKSIGISGDGFKLPTRVTVSNLADPQQSYTPLQEKKVNSLYAAASLSFRDYLFLDVTGRNDWSSTLSADNRSYFYPSVSMSFIPTQAFDLSATPFNFLKVRGSWAQVGNDTSVYQLNETYILASNGYLDLTQISRPTVKANPDLKPESVTSGEIGLEFRMLKSRLYGDFSYYSINSKDLIFDVPVPQSTGYDKFRENVGEMTNKGFELLIGGIPVKTDNFTWDVALNLAKNENKLVSLIDDLDNFPFATTNGGNIQVQATVGGGFGDIYGTTWRTVPLEISDGNGNMIANPSPDKGKILLDSNGRPQASSDRVKLGNYQPDITGGLTNSFNYKNLNFRFLIDFRFGGEVYSGTDASLDASGVSTRTLEYRETGVVLEGVLEDGNGGYVANDKQITGQQYWGSVSGIASEYVYDQTNVRMREIAISYNFPQTLLEKSFIQNASVSLLGRNLFFFYKDIDNFDPESSYSTSNFSQGILYYNVPTVRSIGLNLNIKF